MTLDDALKEGRMVMLGSSPDGSYAAMTIPPRKGDESLQHAGRPERWRILRHRGVDARGARRGRPPLQCRRAPGRLSSRSFAQMKKPLLIPDAPLAARLDLAPMPIPESPHWTIARARAARDAAAQALGDRAAERLGKIMARGFRRRVELVRLNQANAATLQWLLDTLRDRRDRQGRTALDRLLLLARYVAARESAPPRQFNLALAA